MHRDKQSFFDPGLKVGQTINNDELCRIFKCSPQGGMRRSLKTNSLVIVSNHVESVYEDRWVGDVFHYTGMGLRGDQYLFFSQNLTLSMSQSNGVDVFLFEIFESKRYLFQGRVYLTQKPYEEKQPDIDGNLRTVCVFPLKLADTKAAAAIPNETFLSKRENRERQAKRLSAGELKNRAKLAPRKAGNRYVVAKQYDRNEYVAELARRRANGVCQFCDSPAPFKNKKGEPYLEVHHIIWLARGGPDTLDNTVALCPNCHKRMHVLDEEKDKEHLKKIAVLV
jgi:5-methylcytosine-specific restriction protein A